MNFKIYARFLFFTFLLELTSASEVSRIIGGSHVSIEECPYIVSVMTYGSHHCGGTLVRNSWVITAAHCTCFESIPKPADVYSVAAGTSEISSTTIYRFDTKKVTEVYIHPDYDDDFRNDIALLKLKEAYTFSQKIKAATLFSSSIEFDQKNPQVGTVSGWGNTIPIENKELFVRNRVNGELRKHLKQVSVPIHQTETCKTFYSSQRMWMNPESVLCSGGIENEDACQGDSGGPLLFKNYLIGIVSWGVGCGTEGYPGVYTKVDYFLPWVNDTFDGRNIPSAVESLNTTASRNISAMLLWSLQLLIFMTTFLLLF